MEKKARLIIYILIIAILAVALVKLVMLDSLNGVQGVVSDINNTITGDNYTDILDKLFKTIENEDDKTYISLLPLDLVDYSYAPFTAEEAKQQVRMYMPRLGVDYDGIKDKLTYTITDTYEYSGDEINALINTGSFADLSSHSIQKLSKVSLHLIYDESNGLISDYSGELYVYKIQGKWYLDLATTDYLLGFIRPSQYGKIRIKSEYLDDRNSHEPRQEGSSNDITNAFSDQKFLAAVRQTIGKSDGLIYTNDVINITSLDVSYLGISSLAGVEYFTSLSYLDCSGNQLTELDVSSNTELKYLYCVENLLTELDVSGCAKLSSLRCENNQLTVLNISNNPDLWELHCYENNLPELDISSCESLKYLNCYDNQLTKLDVSRCPYLSGPWSSHTNSYLGCAYNNIKSIADIIGWENTSNVSVDLLSNISFNPQNHGKILESSTRTPTPEQDNASDASSSSALLSAAIDTADVFENVLNEYINYIKGDDGGNYNNCEYALYDIDTNGSNELLIRYSNYSDDYIKLYTYANGKANEVGEFWSRNRLLLDEDGNIYSIGSNSAFNSIADRMRISEDGTALVTIEAWEYAGIGETDYVDYIYTSQGVTNNISESEYCIDIDRIFNVTNGVVESLNWKLLSPQQSDDGLSTSDKSGSIVSIENYI